MFCLRINLTLTRMMSLNVVLTNLLIYYVIFESRLILISYTIIKWECNGNGILAMFYLIFYPLHMNIIFNLIKLSERSNFLIIEIILISTWEYQ